jgi:hypothetical protein
MIFQLQDGALHRCGGQDVRGSNVRVESRMVVEEGPGPGREDGALLAAALAAALVEYGHAVRERNGHGNDESVGPQWRMVGCWERMQAD